MQKHICRLFFSLACILAATPALGYGEYSSRSVAEQAKTFYAAMCGPSKVEISGDPEDAYMNCGGGETTLSLDARLPATLYPNRASATVPAGITGERVRNLLLQKGLAGDIQALAMARALPQADPNCPDRGEGKIIEAWLVKHLGEGEATWLLGVMHLYWLTLDAPLDPRPAQNWVHAYLRRSGEADHIKGLFFSSFVPMPYDPNFKPPKGRENRMTLSDAIVGDKKEEYYWRVRAAEAGNPTANFSIGLLYSHDKPGVPEKERIEMSIYYYDRTTKLGDRGGGLYYAFSMIDANLPLMVL